MWAPGGGRRTALRGAPFCSVRSRSPNARGPRLPHRLERCVPCLSPAARGIARGLGVLRCSPTRFYPGLGVLRCSPARSAQASACSAAPPARLSSSAPRGPFRERGGPSRSVRDVPRRECVALAFARFSLPRVRRLGFRAAQRRAARPGWADFGRGDGWPRRWMTGCRRAASVGSMASMAARAFGPQLPTSNRPAAPMPPPMHMLTMP
jgi:hypothetical protein